MVVNADGTASAFSGISFEFTSTHMIDACKQQKQHGYIRWPALEVTLPMTDDELPPSSPALSSACDTNSGPRVLTWKQRVMSSAHTDSKSL